MFWLDPASGRRRRAVVRQRIGSIGADFSDIVGAAGRDVEHRSRGAGARVRSLFGHEEVADEVLTERVRAALGRAVSHPSAIDVATANGRVTLKGPVLERERAELLDVICSVRGISEIADELTGYEDADGIPELQGAHARRRSRFVLLRENWPPAARVLAGASGGALAICGAQQLIGTRKFSLLGACAMAAGGLLLARSATNVPLRRLGGRTGRRAIDVRKTIQVHAPVEQVFDTLAHFENFPSFMRNVRSVRIHPDGRSHWSVAGPAGASVEWDSETTEFKPNELLAWRTLANAPVAHAGIIRFERVGSGTRLDVQMTYNPPGGALGHGIAKLFGADPKRELDEDLMRLKTFVETGVPPHDAARPREATSSAAPREVY
jgi:uncharacterized membrane protein